MEQFLDNQQKEKKLINKNEESLRINIVTIVTTLLICISLAIEIKEIVMSERVNIQFTMILILLILLFLKNKFKVQDNVISKLFLMIEIEAIHYFFINYCVFQKIEKINYVESELLILVMIVFQFYVIQPTFVSIFYSIKISLVCLIYFYHFSQIPQQIVESILAFFTLNSIFLIILIILTQIFSEKNETLYESEANFTNKKFKSLVEAIPLCIGAISKDLDVLFLNSTIKFILKDNNLINFLKKKQYHMRYQLPFEGENLFSDIKNSFSLKKNTKITFGITQKKNILREWSGKIEKWGDVKVIILFGKDVTDIIRLEKELIEDRYKSILLRTVSHELRAPTNAMLSMTECLIDSHELSETNTERLIIMKNSIKYLLYLINDLLDYAQIMAGELKIVINSFNIIELIKECISIFDIEFKKNSINVSIKYLSQVPEEMYSDPLRLKQIILNLLSNAKKFTKKGEIIITVNYKNSKLFISCKDNGLGIEENKLSVLFTAFGKAGNSMINPQGVGLGLHISNMLVKRLGGTGIQVDSKLGEGSLFSFYIDVKKKDTEINTIEGNESHKNSANEIMRIETRSCDNLQYNVEMNDCFQQVYSKNNEGKEKLKSNKITKKNKAIADENSYVTLPPCNRNKFLHNIKKKILIVDDTFFNILAYLHIFERENIDCEYILNGFEAIEKIKKNKYDLVLIDIEMPGMNGFEATQKILKLFENKEISYEPYIIGASSHIFEMIEKEFKTSGMKDYITKPCPKDEILRKIYKAFESQ